MPNLMISLQPRPRSRQRTVAVLLTTALIMVGAVWFARTAAIDPGVRQLIFYCAFFGAIALRFAVLDRNALLTFTGTSNAWALRADGVNGPVGAHVLDGGRLRVEIGERAVLFEPPRYDASVIVLLSRVLADPEGAAAIFRAPQLDASQVEHRLHDGDRALLLVVKDRQRLTPVSLATSGFVVIGVAIVVWLT